MSKKRISANFYMCGRYKYDFNEDRYVWKGLQDQCLYSGWGTQHHTKIKAEDLPEWYVYLENYKKNGYLNTKGVKCAYYICSPFENHWLKDSNLIISYTADHLDIPEPTWRRHQSGWYDVCKWDDKNNLYVFGNDILVALKGIETYSPEVDTTEIRKNIILDYNAYIDDKNKWVREDRGEVPDEHINSLDDILSRVQLRRTKHEL